MRTLVWGKVNGTKGDLGIVTPWGWEGRFLGDSPNRWETQFHRCPGISLSHVWFPGGTAQGGLARSCAWSSLYCSPVLPRESL